LPIPIDPQMLVEDLVREHPRAAAILRDHGVVCMQCGEPLWGTLQEAIEARGKDPAAIIADLRRRLEEGG
jgi:iron-sulfur cluster repair protein YtfE (RIC family)